MSRARRALQGDITDIGARFINWFAMSALSLALLCHTGPADAAAGSPIGGWKAQLQAALDAAAAPGSNVTSALASISAPGLGIEWSGASDRKGSPTAEKPLPSQPFRIASITKVFVAASLFRLIEEQRIGLFQPVAAYLSAATVAQLRSGGYDPDRISFQQLLSHTSGLYDYASDPAFVSAVLGHPHKRWTRAEQVAFAMIHGKPVGSPGERYAYSDTGYIILGEAIENITRHSLGQVLREQLDFKRLALQSTYFESLEPAPPGSLPLAHQYLGTTDTSTFDPSFDLFGGGGLVSTTSDLNRFLRALLQGRIFKHSSTLAAALMTIDAKHAENDRLHANLLTTLRFGKRVCWGHIGFWGSAALYCPDADIAVAMTLNQATPHNPDALTTLARTIAPVLESQQRLPAEQDRR